MKKQVNIRLPEDVNRRLQELAQSTGRTKTFYAEQAILKHLSWLESEYDRKQSDLMIEATNMKKGTHRGEQTT